MRSRVVRYGLVVAAAVLLVMVLALAVLHLPPVQRAAWRWAVDRATAGRPFEVAASDVDVNLLTGTLELEDLDVDADGEDLASARRLSADWSWPALLGRPHRLETVTLEGARIDLRARPEPEGAPDRETSGDGSVLERFEVGVAELQIDRLVAPLPGVGSLEAGDLEGSGVLEDGEIGLEAEAGGLELVRDGRELRLGPVQLEAAATLGDVVVERLHADGPDGRIGLSGTVRFGDDPSFDSELAIQAAAAGVARWWDPSLAERLELAGELDVAGDLGWSRAAGLRGEFSHGGGPLEAFGYRVHWLAFDAAGGRPSFRAAGPAWGSARATMLEDGRLRVVADLETAPTGPVRGYVPEGAQERIPEKVTVSGSVDVVTALPPDPEDPESVSGTADLEARWDGGRLAVEADAEGSGIRLPEVVLEVAGARLDASGRLDADGRLDATAEMRSPDPAAALDALAPWLPGRLDGLPVGGGPVELAFVARGPWRAPRIDLEASWEDPSYGVLEGRSIELAAAGPVDGLEWRLDATLLEDLDLDADGELSVADLGATGRWRLEDRSGIDVDRLTDRLGTEVEVGEVSARGRFRWDGGLERARLRLDADELRWGDWTLDGLEMAADADRSSVQVERVAVRGYGALLQGAGRVPLVAGGRVDLELGLEGLETGRLPLEVPRPADGSVAARITADGPLEAPGVEAVVDWRGAGEAPVLPSVTLRAETRDGVLHLSSDPAEAASGTFELAGTVPLGSLPLPDRVWPRAPSGPVDLRLRATSLRPMAALEAAGLASVPARIETGLEADLRWSLHGDGPRRLEARLPDLAVEAVGDTLRPLDTPVVTFEGSTLELETVRMTGRESAVELAGTLDVASGELAASLSTELGTSFLRLLPVPLEMTGRIRAEAELAGTTDDPEGRIRVEQLEGELVRRDPPVQVDDLSVEVELRDGVWAVVDGAADVNRGRVLVGGEWNRRTGQGVIFEAQDVVFLLPQGILTRWEGAFVVEPAPGRVARVVGDLVLQKGLWDRDVDFASMLLSDRIDADTTSQLLYDVALDLEISAETAVDVENNLGDFEVLWNTLFVSGTPAQPILDGELHIAAGGVITLTGRPIEIARGTVRFDGRPAVEPEVEVIPVRHTFQPGLGGGDGIDAEDLARRGIAGGLTSSLGLSNTTLEPVTIAVETLSDPSTHSLISRQVGRYVALFVASDLGDLQQRTAMIQLYNWRRLPGLALQAFEDTRAGEGYALLERIRWGGTVDTEPRIRRVELEGSWPISKRRLKKATSLRPGQPFEPFHVFVGRVRLERELARAGYYRADVTGRAGEDPQLPKLTFEAVPGPRRQVVFTGGELPEEARREVTAAYRPPPLEDRAFEEMRTIVRAYLDAMGRPFASVEVRRRQAEVVVRVDPGPEVTLRGPQVDGVAAAARDRLREVLGTPATLAVLLRDPEFAQVRVERILSYEGYRGVKVESVDLDRRGSEGTVRLQVSHSGRREIGEITVEGPDPLGAAVPSEIGLDPGEPLRRGAVEQAEHRIRRAYRESGYTDVEVQVEAAGAGLVAPVRVDLDPGTQKRVADVSISGTRHVSRGVIRRGILVEEDEVYDPAAVDRSVVELASFGPVERVDVEVRDAAPGEVDVAMEITERPRWTAGVGVRYTSDTDFQALLDLRDESLFGRGFSLDLRGLHGSDRRTWNLVAGLPRAPGGAWSSSLALSYRDEPSRTDPDAVQEESWGASASATYHLREGVELRPYYTWEDTRSSALVDDPDQPGAVEILQTTVGGQAVVDRLDDPLNPRHGSYLALDVGWASENLGGEVNALRSLLTATWAGEPIEGWTWARSLRLGWAEPLRDDPLVEQVRFFAGGVASVRGFERDLVGPVEVRGDGSLRPLGGGAVAVLNEEIRVPVWGHGDLGIVRVAVFADLGQVWPTWSDADLDLAIGAGVGVRWDSPLGPLWVDVAWPVDGVQGDAGPKLYLGLGRPF